MLNWIVKNITAWSFNYVYLQNVFTNHIINIYVKTLNNQQWYAIKINKQIKQNVFQISDFFYFHNVCTTSTWE